MTNAKDTKDPVMLKEAGNEFYKKGLNDDALEAYTKAIELCEELKDEKTLAICLKNRAAVYLKEENYDATIADCTRCLELSPNDPKALFRRCQAYEAIDKVDAAYKDARECHRVDPNNPALQPVLVRLHKGVSEKLAEFSRTSTKVKNMFEIVFDPSQPLDKREKGADNLVYLARERAGAETLFKEGCIQKIVTYMKIEKNANIRLSLIRCIGEICKKSEYIVKDVLKTCGVPFFLDILNSHNEETVNASSYVIQIILDTLSHAYIMKACKEKKKDQKKMSSETRKQVVRDEQRRLELIKANGKEITSIMHVIAYNTTSRTITGEARDALIELIMKNGAWDELDWGVQLLKTDAYQRLMEVASEMTEYKHESSMEITDNTRSVVGCCLGMIYESMYDEPRRNQMLEEIDKFCKEKIFDPSVESKVRVVVAITTLLKHAPDLGTSQLTKDGMLEMMMGMARTDDHMQQLVAAEALIAATQKKKDSNFIVSNGVEILKQLYKSKNDHIKVRALVGLCKLGASAGHDASMQPFAEGSTEKLAEACRRFLINPGKDRDLRKWAVEGLSFLSLDASVKEKLCEDEPAIRALVELAKSGRQDVAYGVVTLLVNLTNSYEKQEIMPELIELAKFAKHHIPQEHELDDQDFIDKRIWTLAQWGVASALVALVKNESKNIKELIARVLNAICKFSDLRGIVVQQGGSKALLPLALEGTSKGKRHAAQALARIGITQDPAIAFPGQRSFDVIRPISQLLNLECESLENFEALMALGNLASMNEKVRTKILKDADFAIAIEGYMFEEHQLIRRAAVQCFANLCVSDIMVERCEGKNDKVKYVVLLCGDDEDQEIVKAAAGALAMLTSRSKKICGKVFESTQWNQCLLNVVASPDYEIVLRGVVVVQNMIQAGREIAEPIIESQITDCLQAHIARARLDEGSYEPDQKLAKVREVAEETLKIAHKLKLIKTKEEAEAEDSD